MHTAPEVLQPQPAAQALALAPQLYTDPAGHGFETRTIFSRHWQLVAHASQLAASGDHVVCEIAGLPLLIVRGEDGQLRGLHNVCRHRAGPLAECDGRGARRLRCRYHGWSYSLDGRLLTATEMGDAADFDPTGIRLGQVELRLWRGLVFVAVDPAHELTELMRGVDARLGTRDFGTYVPARRDSYLLDCNWKVYVDNYLEGYHLPHVHPGLNRVLDYRRYVTEASHWHVLQHSPLDAPASLYGDGEALYFWLWPNLMLNILPDRLQTNRVVALDVSRCRVDFDYLYPAEVDAEAVMRQEADRHFSDEVQREDGEICAAVQRGLASGAYSPGRLNPAREQGLWHFHEMVRAVWRAGQAGA